MMACGAAFPPDVLRRATELIEAMSVASPGTFEAAVVDGIERLIPGAEVRFATTEEAVVECEIRVELDDAVPHGWALVVARGSQAFCTHDLDLLVLLAPHLRHAYRESRRRGALTPRECEVLQLVGEGLTNRQVARRLGIAPGTVRSHLEHTYSKLEVGTRTAAIAAAG